MCNCGKKRSEFKSQNTNTRDANRQILQQPFYQQQTQPIPAQVTKTVMFQYTGKSALSITGSTTRRNYRFSFPGDIQHIALSDAQAMSNVPVLKKV